MNRTRLARFLTAMLVAALAVAVVPAAAAAIPDGHSVTVQPATVQYSDFVTLRAQVSPAGLAGAVAFTVNGSTDGLVGSPIYRARTGVALQRYRAMLAPAQYDITATFTSCDGLTTASGRGTLTVTPEDARVVFTLNGPSCPMPWVMPVTESGRTEPLSIVWTLVEVPDGAPGDLSKARVSQGAAHAFLGTPPLGAVTSPGPDPVTDKLTFPDGLAPCVLSYQVAVYGYYTGQNIQGLAVYDRKAGMKAGAGTFVNPDNGNFSMVAFVVAPTWTGPRIGVFANGEIVPREGLSPYHIIRTPNVASFTAPAINAAVLSDVDGTALTVTAKDCRVRGSADTIAIDWPTRPDVGVTRLLRGCIDLR